MLTAAPGHNPGSAKLMFRAPLVAPGVVLAVLLLCASGYAQQSTYGQQSNNDVPFVMPLKGRTLEQVVAQFGRPIEAIPLFETGGRLLIFESPHGDHYIIETDVSNRVVDAVATHPENR
jgi:hypothetical protein